MVGGFPINKRAPKPVQQTPTVAPDDVEFDEEGRRRITAPLTPAATRPPPTTSARPLLPMPGAPRPGALPPMPPRPVAPTVRREGPPPPKAATPATAVKRPPPPTPYVRKPAQYLDPETIPFDKPRTYGGRR
ncbi:hypothetical protein CO669_18645 [Bradyrhizobium sp. Y36]|uniref:hypothetical protein n=1 Tax=Bradyrhizobium sp. Y36 TaxID=2035447 RepID=UPI000BE8674A|nr:hypothetical protein [Bradyrhizobium sp. Y36]PDT88781.1 hypothetical protein CO669_18645 [Bradyrhizobium sp. Y36]